MALAAPRQFPQKEPQKVFGWTAIGPCAQFCYPGDCVSLRDACAVCGWNESAHEPWRSLDAAATAPRATGEPITDFNAILGAAGAARD